VRDHGRAHDGKCVGLSSARKSANRNYHPAGWPRLEANLSGKWGCRNSPTPPSSVPNRKHKPDHLSLAVRALLFLLDEADPGGLEGGLEREEGAGMWGVGAALEVDDGALGEPGAPCCAG
jgi:hypothetical protein